MSDNTTTPIDIQLEKTDWIRGDKFILKRVADECFVYDSDGEPLDIGELQSITNSLLFTLSKMEICDCTQDDMIGEQREKRIRQIMQDGIWTFHPTIKQTWKSGPCVYFVQSKSNCDLVKIGQTLQLSTRMKSLGREYLKDKFGLQCLAFVKTQSHKELEFHLHRWLKQYHSHNEWFYRWPIVEFLRQYGNVES